MNFFDNFTRFIDKTISNYVTGEALLIGMFFLILSAFLILVLVHLFSKDFVAGGSFKYINKYLRITVYGPETERIILNKFKTMPYHFYENRDNLNALKFYECVPHYESSKKSGSIFFAVYSLVICLISLVMGLILNKSDLIYLSDAVLIFALGIMLSLILCGIYIYLKRKTYKKLELNFNEFLKLIKWKKTARETTEKFSQSIIKTRMSVENNESKEIIESKNYSELLERIKEVKVKDVETDKIKELINDLANERDNATNEAEKECLTDALTDLLNMINKTA